MKRTSRGALAHARDQLEQVGANVIGAVLNNFDPAKAKAYRHYYGYYGRAYRYGYGGYGQPSYAYDALDNGNARGGGEPRPVLGGISDPKDR